MCGDTKSRLICRAKWKRSAGTTGPLGPRELVERQAICDFAIFRHQRPLGRVCLQVPGRHNVLNALAAAAGLVAWAGLWGHRRGLGQFSRIAPAAGVAGEWRGVTLLDDYAHHPTEIAATLATVRQWRPGRRVWCVFQPHQASRTAALLNELAASLQNTDKLVVADIYRAREPKPQPGEGTAADLAEKARGLGADVEQVHSIEQIARRLETQLRAGDVLITWVQAIFLDSSESGSERELKRLFRIGKVENGALERFEKLVRRQEPWLCIPGSSSAALPSILPNHAIPTA